MLTSNLRSVLVYRYNNYDESSAAEIEGELQSSTQYDVHGNQVAECSYDADGELVHKVVWEYDDQGRLQCESLFDEGDEAVEVRHFTFDEQGRLTLERHEYEHGFGDVQKYSYDHAGNLILKERYDLDEELEGREEYVYDASGKLLEETVTDGEGNKKSHNTYEYSDNGALTSSEAIEIDEFLAHRYVSFYDHMGRKTKALLYNAKDQLIQITKYHYNEKGILIGMDEEDQSKKSHTDYIYNEDGSLMSQIETSENAEVLSRIDRKMNEQGRVSEALVFVKGTGSRLDQKYLLEYEYKYWDE